MLSIEELKGACAPCNSSKASGDFIQSVCACHVCTCIASAQNACCHRRFPDSESSSHFWSNLLAGRNMCTQDERRWPVGLYGTPERFGKLVEYNRFDASFFSVHGKQAQVSPALLLQSACKVK